MKEQFFDVMCFQRKSKYYPPNIAAEAEKICKKSEKTPVENWEWDDRSLLFGYDLINEYLPGKDREKFKSVGSLYDVRIRKGKVSYRLYDRSLRNKHSADAPFALDDFEQGFNIYEERKGEMTLVKSEKFKANSSFDDSKPERYLNSHLPFGGVKIPQEGLKFKLARPKKKAPKDARVKVYFEWSR